MTNERITGRAHAAPGPPTISGRWLISALGISLSLAALCCWGAFCLLFWQGSWQLLYHPASAVTRTPASVGLKFDPVSFAVDETGRARLAGWWIPAEPQARFDSFTVLYLHGRDGNLGNTADALFALHSAGVNVLAIDYRGYGQSQFVRPSEAHWREDAEWALQYLEGTRHVAAGSIVLDGDELGADLALEIAAAHPELAGVVVRDPIPDAANAIFNDGRARLVPARLLVRDRYDVNTAAMGLRIPSLWFYRETAGASGGAKTEPEAFEKASARKMLVWLGPHPAAEKDFEDAVSRWLGDLTKR